MTDPTPTPEDVERAKRHWREFIHVSSVSQRLHGLALEFARVREDGWEACAKLLSDRMFKILGSPHPDGRAAAHHDAATVGACVEAIRARSTAAPPATPGARAPTPPSRDGASP